MSKPITSITHTDGKVYLSAEELITRTDGQVQAYGRQASKCVHERQQLDYAAAEFAQLLELLRLSVPGEVAHD